MGLFFLVMMVPPLVARWWLRRLDIRRTAEARARAMALGPRVLAIVPDDLLANEIGEGLS